MLHISKEVIKLVILQISTILTVINILGFTQLETISTFLFNWIQNWIQKQTGTLDTLGLSIPLCNLILL